MTRLVFDNLLAEARKTHEAHSGLSEFCPFARDISPQHVKPHPIKSADYLAKETALLSKTYPALRDAFIAASPFAKWRETYRGTDIGQDFLDRFGCYCLIGAGGAFASRLMAAYVVYMPPGLYYPWHHHPGEEMYIVLAGEAEFMRDGEANETLREGETIQHASNQPHAMQTHDHPVMAYVVRRSGFETPPVLT